MKYLHSSVSCRVSRILFVTTKIGFGHEKVSRVLAEAIKDEVPGCDIKTVTYFDFFHPRFLKIINLLYLYGLKWFPKILGYIYIRQKNYKGGGVDFWSRFLGRQYAKIIQDYDPSLIIITQGLACQWLGRLKRKKLINAPLIAVLTDYVVHPFWVSKEIDLYFVATQDMKEDLVSRGISGHKIVVSGIPIDTRFSFLYDKTQLEEKIGLEKDKITLLIMGGGWGLGNIDKIIRLVERIDLPLQFLVVTGRNRGLYRRLKRRRFRIPFHIYGKVDNMPELMAVSDVIITKAGGVTISEVLAVGLPAVLWDIIPGQEEANADCLLRNDAGIRINRIFDVEKTIKVLVSDSELMDRMKKCSKRLGNSDSTAKAIGALKKYQYV